MSTALLYKRYKLKGLKLTNQFFNSFIVAYAPPIIEIDIKINITRKCVNSTVVQFTMPKTKVYCIGSYTVM